jgi:hypothetical protein
MSLDVPAISALLELANGVEAQPARIDAAVINNVPPRIQADFVLSVIAIPHSSSLIHPGSLYDIVRLGQSADQRTLSD